MIFPLGKSIFVLGVIALVSGVAISFSRPAPASDLVVWCFSAEQAGTYRDNLPLAGGGMAPSLIEQFRKTSGLSVDVQLLAQQAEDVRLVSLFISGASGRRVPDLCEIEISSVGKFFRPPPDDVGLLPLNDFLAASGQYDRILASRLAPWSKVDPETGKTIIFGVPADVHPVSLVYRKDLFEEAGIDPARDETWEQFRQSCLQLQKYFSANGRPGMRALAVSTVSSDTLSMMLLQRHVNLVDATDTAHFSDPKVADTIAFYAGLVAGDNSVAADASSMDEVWAKSLEDGEVAAVIAPDWKIAALREFAPSLAGRVRMMPLPRFDADDAPTSTWGGTMIGIPRACPHPEQAWKLLRFLYLSPEGIAARSARGSDILPSLPKVWSQPQYHQPDPYFGGQKVDELLVQLAGQIPRRDITPWSVESQLALAEVLHRAEEHVKSHGKTGLRDAVAAWLADAQQEFQRRIDFGRISP